MKSIYTFAITLLALCVALTHANPVDVVLDGVREPVARPNTDIVKSWLSGNTIVLERTSRFKRDISETLEPTKIQNLKHVDGSVFQKAIGSNYGIGTYTFSYPYNGKMQNYTATITYVWAVATISAEIRRSPEKVTITGP